MAACAAFAPIPLMTPLAVGARDPLPPSLGGRKPPAASDVTTTLAT